MNEFESTTQPESGLNSVKQAFAPVSDALKNFQNLDVPEVTRDLVRRVAGTAKEKAADIHAGSEKLTTAIETAATGSVIEAAKISRNVQQAIREDAEALFAGIDRLASAKSISEAVQIQSDALRSYGEIVTSRTKTVSEYLGKLVADGAKTAQDNFSKVAAFTKTA